MKHMGLYYFLWSYVYKDIKDSQKNRKVILKTLKYMDSELSRPPEDVL